MAKNVKDRKRHIVTAACGLLVGDEVHPADIQDRDGAGLVIAAIRQLFPWLRHLFADSLYNGPNLRKALAKYDNWTIEIVKRAADAVGYQLLPQHNSDSEFCNLLVGRCERPLRGGSQPLSSPVAKEQLLRDEGRPSADRGNVWLNRPIKMKKIKKKHRLGRRLRLDIAGRLSSIRAGSYRRAAARWRAAPRTRLSSARLITGPLTIQVLPNAYGTWGTQ